MRFRKSTGRCRSLALCSLAAAGPAWAGTYTYTEIVIPGATVRAAAVNTRGLAVANATDDGTGEERPLTFSGGVAMVFNPPYQTSLVSYASGVNDKGQIAATYRTKGGQQAVYVHSAASGRNTKLKGPGSDSAVGIDRAGDVAAIAAIGTGEHGLLFPAAGSVVVLDPPGSNATQPYTISDGGIVGGRFSDHGNTQTHGFTYAGGAYTVIDVPGAIYTDVLAVNDAGSVGGSYTDTANVDHGYTRVGTTFRTYDYPGAFATKVVAVLKTGQVIGLWYDTAGLSHGFTHVGTSFYPLEPPGAIASSIGGVDRNGDFAVISVDTSGTLHGFVAICPAGQAPCTG